MLVYHQIRTGPNDPPEGMTVVTLDRFKQEMRSLHDQGYRSLGMDEVVRFLRGEPFPPKVVAIQFDDGWNSARKAVPVLERYKFKATFWIIAGDIGSGKLFMTWPVVRRLDRIKGFEIGSHSMTHPIDSANTMVDWVAGRTPGKSAADAREELAGSKSLLEKKLGHPIAYFNWPAGIFDDELVAMAKDAGYTALVTTVDGLNHPGDDPLRIHRTLVDGTCGEREFAQILSDGRYEKCEAK